MKRISAAKPATIPYGGIRVPPKASREAWPGFWVSCQLSWRKALDEPHGNAAAVWERLRQRADFLRAAKGKRFHARGLTLQSAPRPITPPRTVGRRAQDDRNIVGAGVGSVPCCPETPPRFGFTVTKQSGGAVQRNRIRRRLREALRLLKPLPARPGHDYVIFARPEALRMSFTSLQAELMRALGKIDTRKNPPPVRPVYGSNDTVAGSAGEARRKSSKGRTPKG
jgi:ribonuclease P protein component